MSKHHPKPLCLDLSGRITDSLDFRNALAFHISKIGNWVPIFKISQFIQNCYIAKNACVFATLKLHSNFKDSGKSTDLLNHKNHNVIFNDMGRHYFEDQ